MTNSVSDVQRDKESKDGQRGSNDPLPVGQPESPQGSQELRKQQLLVVTGRNEIRIAQMTL